MEVLQKEMYKMKRVEARKRLIETYKKRKSIRKTAKLWGTSRLVVRKWVRRYYARGDKRLEDVSRRPIRFPNRTPLSIEKQALKMDYGRRGIAWFLLRENNIEISG